MPNVLILQLARFGDLVQTKRLVLSLARRGVVHLAVDRSLAALAAMLYPQAVVHALWVHAGPATPREDVLRANRPLLAELKALDFEAVYNLNLSPMSFALAALWEPERVRGHYTVAGQPHRDPWPRLAMRLTRRRVAAPLNLADYWAHFCDHAEGPVEPGEVNPVARRPRGEGVVGVVLAGRESRRSLPPQVLAPIVRAVMAATEARRVTLLGTAAEKPLARAFKAAAARQVLDGMEDRCGKTSLTDLPEVLAGMTTVLTPDTGTMHLAAHLGAPVQAFFLSSAWAWETGPYGMGHRVWQAVRRCAPCLESAPCHEDLACLEPFAGQAFLRLVSGAPHPEPVEGVLGLTGVLDGLGQSFLPVFGADPYGAERQGLRDIVAEHLGRGGAGGLSRRFANPYLGEALERLPAGPDQAGRVFAERDWMLPPRPNLQPADPVWD